VLWLPLTVTGIAYLLLGYPARQRSSLSGTGAAQGQERT
jgi:hypothetical protein